MKKDQAKVLVNRIRQEFPNPKSAKSGDQKSDRDFCVGGAFCIYALRRQVEAVKKLFHDMYNVNNTTSAFARFPTEGCLRAVMRSALPNSVPDSVIYTLVYDLIRINDAEEYELAWEKLTELLELAADEGESNEEGSSESICARNQEGISKS